jgi:hypothetical protein
MARLAAASCSLSINGAKHTTAEVMTRDNSRQAARDNAFAKKD